jgi:hypothetical protein
MLKEQLVDTPKPLEQPSTVELLRLDSMSRK